MKGSTPVKAFKGEQTREETFEGAPGDQSEGFSKAAPEHKKRDGQIIEEMTMRGVGHFNPDLMFEQMTQNYDNAKDIYGPRLLTLATGESSEYVERNIRIPEFQRELKSRLKEQHKSLEKAGLTEFGNLTEEGLMLAARNLLTESVEQLYASSFNEDPGRAKARYGVPEGQRPYRDDPYRDIDLRRSVRTAIRRGHSRIVPGDLRAKERAARSKREIVFAVDVSGSMKSEKIAQARKAFFTLAARAREMRDPVGLILFTTDVVARWPTGSDLVPMLKGIMEHAPRGKTNIATALKGAHPLFAQRDAKRHVIMITDIAPTDGEQPERAALAAAGLLSENDVSVSIVAIATEHGGAELGRRICEMTDGTFYEASASQLGSIVLQDYDTMRYA